MRPGVYDLNLYYGDSFSWWYVLWADAEKTIPLDLTGVEIEAEIRDHPGGSTIISMTCIAVTGDDGKSMIHVELDNDMWTDWPFELRRGVWDLQTTYPGDFVSTIVSGTVTIVQDVTDSPEVVELSAERRVS